MSITTRFAPSPTGYLHIGGARTALFSWLLAKNKGGHFLLRVEDTDRERSTKEATDAIIQAMAWLDLAAEGTAVFQSERFDIYNSYIDQLLANGHAYWCSCTPEEVEAMEELLIADPEVGRAICLEIERQTGKLEMIASENFVSTAVRQAQGSVLTHKYAEGYPGKRYYGGCEYVDIAEDLARDRVKKLFGATYANVQPHSGSQANMVNDSGCGVKIKIRLSATQAGTGSCKNFGASVASV